MRNIFVLSALVVSVLFFSCHDYKKDLTSGDKTKIMEACFELGEAKDTSAVKSLLTKIIDWRESTNLRFKGMSVYQCRVGALRKISGIQTNYNYYPDTAVVNIYLKWAIQKGFIKNIDEIDLYYDK